MQKPQGEGLDISFSENHGLRIESEQPYRSLVIQHQKEKPDNQGERFAIVSEKTMLYGSNIPATFYVIDGNHSSLLSHATATDLGILKVDGLVNAVAPDSQLACSTKIQALEQEYADLFEGIGELDGSVCIHY